MNVKLLTIDDSAYPSSLADISSPPKQLYYLGADPEEWTKRPSLAILGSRSITPYGRRVTEDFAFALSQKGFTIISGLALGVDATAHAAALKAGGRHLAVVASGLDKISPTSNLAIARQLLEQGGAIISEYPEGTDAFKQNFVARNRMVSGLADAILITEATEKSGTFHTVRFALEQGKDVMVVPGNITSPNSVGCNNLIKSGAIPVCSVEDVLQVLGADNLAETTTRQHGDTPAEEAILNELYNGNSDAHLVRTATKMSATEFNQTLTMLELGGKIRPLSDSHWAPV